jgi:membrane protein implicated in regulation of membrane protease activity
MLKLIGAALCALVLGFLFAPFVLLFAVAFLVALVLLAAHTSFVNARVEMHKAEQAQQHAADDFKYVVYTDDETEIETHFPLN